MSTQSGTSAGRNLLDSLFNAASNLASPLAERLINAPSSERNASNQSIAYDRLNGSGAPDPAGQRAAPQTMGEFLFGRPGGGTVPATPAPDAMSPLWFIVGGLILILVWKRL